MGNYSDKVVWTKELKGHFDYSITFIKDMTNKMFWIHSRKRRLSTHYEWFVAYEELFDCIHQIEGELFVLNFEYDTNEDCRVYLAYSAVIDDLKEYLEKLDNLSVSNEFGSTYADAVTIACSNLRARLNTITMVYSDE